MKVFHQSSFDRWPFDDKSIQAIMTSPPYYSLRKYDIPDIIIGGNPECEHEWSMKRNDKTGGIGEASNKQVSCADNGGGFTSSSSCYFCNTWRGQYGLEPTYQLYIEHTLLWAKEAWRVLKDDGVFFLNIGDSWNGGKGKSSMAWSIQNQERDTLQKSYTNLGGMGETRPLDMPQDVPSKCKLLIPHRVAIGLIEQGWILRNDIVWSKPNAMPESVRDRFSKKFEYIFMLSKTGKYYFDLDAVRLPESQSTKQKIECEIKRINNSNGLPDYETLKAGAAYKRPILPSMYRATTYGDTTDAKTGNKVNPGDIWTINTQPSPEKHYAMWPESLVERMILCSTKSGDAILDPFAGSGCTLRVADKLNRVAYGIDLGYQDIQERRMTNIQKVLY